VAGLSSYDTLTVTGAATLTGTLNVSLLNGFTPSSGSSFPVFSASPASGLFAVLGGSSGLCMSWSGSAMSLAKQSAACGAHGDPNGDGAVTVADVFTLVNTALRRRAPAAGTSDANGDRRSSVSDVFSLVNFLFAGGPAPQ